MRIVYTLIAILLGVDNVFIRLRIGSISYDRLIEIFLFVILFGAYLKELRTNPFFKKWNIYLVAFGLLQLVINLKLAVVGSIPFEEVYEDFFKCFSFIVFSFLFLLIAKKDLKYLNILLFVHFLICVFAFLQHPFSPIAAQMLEIKRLLYASVEGDRLIGRLETEEVYIAGGYSDRFRLAGPFASTITFSYFALSSVFISFYLYLKSKKRIYLWMLVTLLTASLLTQTRSLLLAEIFLIFGYLFFNPGRKHALYKFGIVTFSVLALTFAFTVKDGLTDGNSRITRLSSGGEGDSRPLLWLTGVYAVINYPLGITYDDYETIKKEVYYKTGSAAVLFLSSHNGIINIGFHYSMLGYLLFIFLVLFLLRYIQTLGDKFRLYFKLVFISYLIHISFHNNFFLNADYPFLMVIMLIGLEYSMEKISRTEQKSNLYSKGILSNYA